MAQCETIGVLDLYDTDAHDCPDENLRGARWLADLATAYILLTARLHSAENLATQLQHALDSRAVRLNAVRRGVATDSVCRPTNGCG